MMYEVKCYGNDSSTYVIDGINIARTSEYYVMDACMDWMRKHSCMSYHDNCLFNINGMRVEMFIFESWGVLYIDNHRYTVDF